jgi:hypothetical protein
MTASLSYKRLQAIEMLLTVTSVDAKTIADHEDYELFQWLLELGYEWDEWNHCWFALDED